MRCNCLKCGYNDEYYCGLPEGKVAIEEDGTCNNLWIRSNADNEGEEVSHDVDG